MHAALDIRSSVVRLSAAEIFDQLADSVELFRILRLDSQQAAAAPSHFTAAETFVRIVALEQRIEKTLVVVAHGILVFQDEVAFDRSGFIDSGAQMQFFRWKARSQQRLARRFRLA